MQKLRVIVDKLAPLVLAFYFFVGILAYVNIWPGSARFFYSSSTSGIIIRAISTALICAYSVTFFLVHRYEIKIQFRWLALFCIVLIANFISMFASTHDYYFYYTASLYGWLHAMHVSVGARTLMVMFLSSLSDFALGFCFLFLLPYSFKKRELILFIAVPIVLFVLYESAYSFVAEMDKYKTVIGGSSIYGGYDVSIGSTFGDKQEFGAFLNIGFCASLLACFCVPFRQVKWRYLVRCFFCVCGFVFFFQSFLILCKTAILANILYLITLATAGFIFLFRKNKTAAFVSVALLSLVIVSVVLIISVEPLHANGIFADFYKIVDRLFLSKINYGIWSRFTLVRAFFERMDPVNFLFGFSKGGVSAYMSLATSGGTAGLHTGFVFFQACYGIFGSILYFLLLGIVIRNQVRLAQRNLLFGLAVFGCFLCSLVFNLAECEVLIFSGSAPIFFFNVVCVIFPAGAVMNEKV